ncbi:hypothetical protein EDD22DRAFT_852685 [Suillus occidentalis]|nr:hypothetical protein EDD22DRAFT_852685 [Suillus occidentalis]
MADTDNAKSKRMVDTDNAKSKRMVDTDNAKSKRAADTDNAKSKRQSKSLEKLVGVFAAEKWLWWPDNIAISVGMDKRMQQQAATKRWMSNPSVRSTQNEKARIRMANRKATGGDILPSSDEQHDASSDDDATYLPRTSNIKLQTIQDLQVSICRWQYDWGPANIWEKTFNEKLWLAQDRGNCAVSRFFDQCEQHTSGGRALLADLKRIAYAPCSNGRQARDRCIHLYDLVFDVLSEVKFFEVKLDEYVPAVPLSQLSSTQYYEHA